MATENWLKELLKKLQEYLGKEYQVAEVESSKAAADGDIQISIMKNGERTGILMELESEKVQRLQKGINPEDEVNLLAEIYRKKRSALLGMLGGIDFAMMKDRIVFALERKEGNEYALAHIPWIDFHDMAIVFYLLDTSGEDTNYRVISEEDLDVWKISKEEIWEIARENTPKLCKPLLLTMEHAMKDTRKELGVPREDMRTYLFRNSESDNPIFVLTNDQGFYGASVILYDDLLNLVGRAWIDDVLVIPTSINEVVIVPGRRIRNTVPEWREILRQLNEKQSIRGEALSDSVYFYDKREGTLDIAKDSWEKIFD